MAPARHSRPSPRRSVCRTGRCGRSNARDGWLFGRHLCGQRQMNGSGMGLRREKTRAARRSPRQAVWHEATPDSARAVDALRSADDIIARLIGPERQSAGNEVYFFHQIAPALKEIWAMELRTARTSTIASHKPHYLAVTPLPVSSPQLRDWPSSHRKGSAGLSWSFFPLRTYGAERRIPAGIAGGSHVFSPRMAGPTEPRSASRPARHGDPCRVWVPTPTATIRMKPDFSFPRRPMSGSVLESPKTNSQIAWVSGRTGLPQILHHGIQTAAAHPAHDRRPALRQFRLP